MVYGVPSGISCAPIVPFLLTYLAHWAPNTKRVHEQWCPTCPNMPHSIADLPFINNRDVLFEFLTQIIVYKIVITKKLEVELVSFSLKPYRFPLRVSLASQGNPKTMAHSLLASSS